MHTRWSRRLLLAATVVCCVAARPQAPAPPPPPPQPAADTFFPGIAKFERNAAHVTRVESDHNHNRRDSAEAPGEPRRLSTVYVFGYDRPGLYNPADVEPYRLKLHTADWTCKTCEGRLKPGEAIDACTRPLGSSSVESVVIDMRLQRLTFVHTIGQHSHDDNVMNCREE